MRSTLLLAACLWLTSFTVFGDVPASTAEGESVCERLRVADIWKIESGGLWRNGGEYGNYHVIVSRRGIEHLTDKLFVRVSKRLADGSKVFVACGALDFSANQGSVTDIEFRSVDDRHVLVTVFLEMKAMEGVRLAELFLVSVEGKSKRIVTAKYVDIYDFKGDLE